MDEIKKKLNELEQKIDLLNQKIDALVLADEEAHEILHDDKAEVTDEEFIDAVCIAVEHERISASLLQRTMGVSFLHASRIVELMEAEGVLSSQDGAKPRQVLIRDAKSFLEEYINRKFRN